MKRDTESGRSAAVAALDGPVEGASRPAAAPSARKSWQIGLVALAVAIFAIAGYEWRAQPSRDITSMAVLPFVNATSEENNEFLSDGLTEELISVLSQLPNMRVMARATVFHFKGKEDDPVKIGQLLKVSAVLTGRVTKRGNDLHVTTDLVNAADGTEIWGAQYTRKIAEVSTLQDEITREVVGELRSKLTGAQQKQIARATTANSEAYQLYLRGRYYWNQRGSENLKKSIELFKQAIDTDPAYALAYAGLADAYNVAPGYFIIADPRDTNGLATSAARKAVELDPQLADGHGALAGALIGAFKWPDAEKEFQRAIDLSPNNANFYYFRGLRYLLAMGQTEVALGEMRSALVLDPMSPIINANYGFALCTAHRYDEALQQFRKAVDLDPNFPGTLRKFSYLYASTGKWSEAEVEFRKYAVQVLPVPPVVSPTAPGLCPFAEGRFHRAKQTRSRAGDVVGCGFRRRGKPRFGGRVVAESYREPRQRVWVRRPESFV